MFGVNINNQKELILSILMVNVFSIVSGIYLGQGYSKLKQSYIWIINKKYQKHLIKTSLILSIIFSIFFVPFILVDLVNSVLFMLVSFITIMYCIHVAIGNILLKRALLVLPFLYLFLINNKYTNISILTLFIIIQTLAMVILIIINFRKTKNQQTQVYKLAIDKNPEILRKKFIGNKIDYYIGKIILKFKWSKKSKINIAIMSPVSITGIHSFFYIPIVIYLSLINGYNNSSITVETVSSMIFAFLLIVSFLHTLPLLKQTSKFAHIYMGKNHAVLKNKILLAIDKALLVNSIVYIGGILIIINLFSLSINVQYFLITSIIVFTIALAIYPVVLSMNHFIPFPILMILSIVVYFGVISFNTYWILPNISKVLSFPYISFYLFSCLIIRQVSQFAFRKIRYENLIC